VLQAIVCHLLARPAPRRDRLRRRLDRPGPPEPVGDTGRREPRQIDTIIDTELQRAPDDPDRLRGIAQLVARWCAAFVLDPTGVTRTKALGTERMARRLHDALPGGENSLRAAVWELLRPMLSPRLAEVNRDAFVSDDATHSTVDLAAHRGESGLDDLDVGDDEQPPCNPSTTHSARPAPDLDRAAGRQRAHPQCSPEPLSSIWSQGQSASPGNRAKSACAAAPSSPVRPGLTCAPTVRVGNVRASQPSSRRPFSVCSG